MGVRFRGAALVSPRSEHGHSEHQGQDCEPSNSHYELPLAWPVRLLRNATMHETCGSGRLRPSCTRPIVMTACSSVGADPSGKYCAVSATLRRLRTRKTARWLGVVVWWTRATAAV